MNNAILELLLHVLKAQFFSITFLFFLLRMMTSLCFNSVPMELVADSTGDSQLTPKVLQFYFLFLLMISGKSYNFD